MPGITVHLHLKISPKCHEHHDSWVHLHLKISLKKFSKSHGNMRSTIKKVSNDKFPKKFYQSHSLCAWISRIRCRWRPPSPHALHHPRVEPWYLAVPTGRRFPMDLWQGFWCIDSWTLINLILKKINEDVIFWYFFAICIQWLCTFIIKVWTLWLISGVLPSHVQLGGGSNSLKEARLRSEKHGRSSVIFSKVHDVHFALGLQEFSDFRFLDVTLVVY